MVPVMMRLAPSCFAIMDIAVMKATGIPSFSIDLAIADPLRVQEPQVDTSKTASIPLAFSSVIISFPIRCMIEITPREPGVIKK